MARRRLKTQKGQLELWAHRDSHADEGSPADGAASYTHGSWIGRKVHLIGVGGIGMSGIARLLISEGCIVAGCDARASDITAGLSRDGITVSLGHSPEHLDKATDVVIISAAIRETNPELRVARRRGIQVLKYAQALGLLMADREGVAVSGSHGKTTTASMIAYAMSVAGRNPGMVIGGLVPQLGGSARRGDGGPFVVEACEYDRSFLSFTPTAAVITNIDYSHPDYYPSIEDQIEAFGNFAARVRHGGIVAANGDDPHALRAAAQASARVETFGLSKGCTWRIGEWNRENGRTHFRVYYKNRMGGQFELRPPGLYNIRNAVACLAVCAAFGVAEECVRKALAAFAGVRRRFDRLGEVAGVTVLDDYGHHPTEVRVTLDAVRNEFPGHRLICVFQPHQHSRTRVFLKEFARSFDPADRVIVPDIYPVRDTEADRRSIHARDLVAQLTANGVRAEYRGAFKDVIVRLLNDVRQGDLVITMGAGPVDNVGKRLIEALRKRARHKEYRRQTSDELVCRS